MPKAIDGAFGDAGDLRYGGEVDAVLREGDSLGAGAGVEGEAARFGGWKGTRG